MIEFKKYLPIGSVVLLKNANKRLMIYGRLQKAEDSDSVRDYIGCLYPTTAPTTPPPSHGGTARWCTSGSTTSMWARAMRWIF